MKTENRISPDQSELAFQVNLGGGRQLEVEYQSDNTLWAVAGPAVKGADLWLKAIVAELHLRIRVLRTDSGLEVSLDRGDQDVPWWPDEQKPRLIVTVEPDQNSLSISACIGVGTGLRQAILGSIPICGK
jgi:hypothetical protein